MIRLAGVAHWSTAAALLALIGIAVWLLYRPEAGRLSRGRFAAMLGLRFAWLAIIAVILLRPVRLEQRPPDGSAAIFLFDSSLSMSLPEGGQSRFQAAHEVAGRVAGLLGPGWQRQDLNFAGTAPVSDTAPVGRATDLAGALAAAGSRIGSTRLIVLLSDGVRTAGENPAQAARDLARREIPVIALAPSAAAPGEPLIREIQYDPQPIIGKETELSVLVGGAGAGVIVIRQGAGTIAQVPFTSDGPAVPVPLRYTPTAEGMTELTVELSPAGRLETGCTIAQRVRPPAKKTIAVLWQEPAWDLRAALDAIDGLGQVAVSVHAPGTGGWQSPKGVYGIPDLPYADAFIISGLPAGAVSRPVQERIVSAVRAGAGLVMLGGEQSFGAGGWQSTPLATALPVEITAANDLFNGAPVTPVAPPAAVGDRLLGGFAGSALFPVSSYHAVTVSKPLTVPLALLPGTSGGAGGTALLARGKYGEGNTLAVAISGYWRWLYRHPQGRAAVREFWRQAVEYLAPAKAAGLNCAIPSVWGAPGAPVTASVTVATPGGRIGWTARGAGVERRGTLSASGGELVLTPAADGTLRLDLTRIETASRQRENLRAIVNVSSSILELREPGPDRQCLREIALLTSGAEGEFADAESILARFITRPRPGAAVTETDCWDRPWLFVLVVMLAAGEWLLRRRWGLP